MFVRVYRAANGVYTLIPDSDLPGNEAGFATGPLVLTDLDTYDYPSLALGVTLMSSDPNVTPELLDWSLSYAVTEPPIPNVPFVLRGDKSIGMTAGGVPVRKYEHSDTTGVSGERTFGNMEWDGYTVTLGTTAYDIAAACPSMPYALDPADEGMITLTLVPPAANTLRVTVLGEGARPVHGATVELSRNAFSAEEETGACGQVFFNSGTAGYTGGDPVALKIFFSRVVELSSYSIYSTLSSRSMSL